MNNTTAAPETEKYELYRYVPSLVGAIVFVVLFGATSIIHTMQIVRTRTWYFIPFLIGGLMETIGYVGRCLSHYDKEKLGPFVMQTLLLLVAPALFAASIYMVLGRLMCAIGAEKYSVIRINWLTKVFVGGDVLSFLMQSAGGGIMAGGDADKMKLGENVIIGGLFAQIIFFGLFIVVAIVFDRRIRAHPTPESQAGTYWRTLLHVLYAASALIMVRSIFRVIEYIQGNAGYLLRNEVWLYIFDAVLMFAVMVLFNFVHPSRVVPGKRMQRDSEEAMESVRDSQTDVFLTDMRRR